MASSVWPAMPRTGCGRAGPIRLLGGPQRILGNQEPTPGLAVGSHSDAPPPLRAQACASRAPTRPRIAQSTPTLSFYLTFSTLVADRLNRALTVSHAAAGVSDQLAPCCWSVIACYRPVGMHSQSYRRSTCATIRTPLGSSHPLNSLRLYPILTATCAGLVAQLTLCRAALLSF